MKELTMHERKKLSKSVASRYRRSTKKEKGKILDEFVGYTGYNRNYAAHLLSTIGKEIYLPVDAGVSKRIIASSSARKKGSRKNAKGGRPPTYDEAVVTELRKVWQFFDYPCGKLLKPLIEGVMDYMDADPLFSIEEPIRKKLLSISASSIDRLLRDDKQSLRFKAQSMTKQGVLLKNQIPIRVYYQWDELKVGFFEMDTVSHNGGNPSGHFCRTLTLSDVYSGWTENRALLNGAHRWVKEKIEHIHKDLSFDILGVDSDNGGEFINHQLLSWCNENKITFTRTRSYRKNDNCFVEQKNGDFVRKTVGYYRFDTEMEYEALKQVYRYLCPLRNYYYPTIRISAKMRLENGRYKKKYDKPMTPYSRIMGNPDISPQVKEELTRRRQLTNPLSLKRKLNQAVANLLSIHQDKHENLGSQESRAFG